MKTSHHPSMSDKIKKGLTDKGITTRSVVAFFIFGMIVLVFVLSDLTGRHNGSVRMGSAAEVNGEIISVKDFQEEENKLSQYYSQMFGGQFDMGMQRAMLRGEVMNSLVTKALASQAAEKEGIFATDAEIVHMIKEELPYFKKDGAFQTDAYKAVLSANRLTPGEFEKKLRQDIKTQRSRMLFETSLSVGELQKNIEKELHSAKINLQYIQLSPAEYAKTHEISNDVASKKLAEPDFKKKVEDYFKGNEASFETKEQVKASHILIKLDPANEKAAQAKAEAVLKRVAKEDFGKVASQVSDDPGSKTKKGELGFFGRGRMVKEFEEAAFSTPVGKTSGLIKSSFGYHIIKVTDKIPAAKADFEKSKMIIAKKLIAEEEFSALVKAVESHLAVGKADEALAVLATHKINWKETGFFDIGAETIPGINSPQALKVAFELNKTQPIAKKLVREGENQFLFKFKEAKTEVVDLKAQEQEMLERQKSAEVYRSWVENFKKSAKIDTNTNLMKEN